MGLHTPSDVYRSDLRYRDNKVAWVSAEIRTERQRAETRVPGMWTKTFRMTRRLVVSLNTMSCNMKFLVNTGCSPRADTRLPSQLTLSRA